MEELNEILKEWNYVYNYVRPHQSLGYFTPVELLNRWIEECKERGQCVHHVVNKDSALSSNTALVRIFIGTGEGKERLTCPFMNIDAKNAEALSSISPAASRMWRNAAPYAEAVK